MAEIRRLKNPPIAEAVIFFGTHIAAPINEAEFDGNVPPELRQAFPVGSKMRAHRVQMTAGGDQAEPSVESQEHFAGFRLSSEDGSRVVRFANDHFSSSVVGKYTTWEEFVGFARMAWGHYVAIAKPTQIHRVGLRYINRCQVPAQGEIEEYLRGGPKVPAEVQLPGTGLSGFISQVQLSIPGGTAVVTQALEGALEGLAVVIDIDVVKSGLSLPPEDSAVWARLDTFRDWKNKLFFAHVTEKLLEPYK